MFNKLKQAGFAWNHQCIYRIYCKLGLNLRKKPKKRLPSHDKLKLIPPSNLMKSTTILRFIIAVIIAGIAGDFIHIYYGHLVAGVTIYNSFINTMSFLTKPLEALGVALVYYLIGNCLYFNSRLMRAILLTVLICLIKDGFIRQPLMNILLGNPILDSIYRESQVWISSLVVSLIITFMITPKMEE